MAIVENLDIGKHETLNNNRDKIIKLIFNNPKKYLKEEIFEELCDNDKLTDYMQIQNLQRISTLQIQELTKFIIQDKNMKYQ